MNNLDSVHSFGPGVFLLNRDSSCYQYPEKFAISKIVQDPEANIAMNLDFVCDEGMTRQEAVEMNNKCIQEAEESFPSLECLGHSAKGTLFTLSRPFRQRGVHWQKSQGDAG